MSEILLQSTGTSTFNTWNSPVLIETKEIGESIEMIFKETSMLALAIYPPRPPEQRVFKIVYSCKNGLWNKSERIYGKIIPATNENFSFENEN